MDRERSSRTLLIAAAAIGCAAWAGAAILWARAASLAGAASLFLLGVSLGPCLAVYAVVRRAQKQKLRRVVLFAGGLSVAAFSLLGATNLDMEGFFLLVFSGTMGAAVGHTLVTTIIGPVIFGRLLCGWGCWRSMVLELLPVGRGEGRRGGAWRFGSLAGLAAAAAIAAVAILAFHFRPAGLESAAPGATGLLWILTAFGVYYLASIGLAFALNDKRAFCKYLCPTSAVLSLTSRASILKMAINRDLCDSCGACSRICPMDIDVAHYAVRGSRVTSGQCILCQSCAHACPERALTLSRGLDFGARTAFFTPRVRPRKRADAGQIP